MADIPGRHQTQTSPCQHHFHRRSIRRQNWDSYHSSDSTWQHSHIYVLECSAT